MESNQLTKLFNTMPKLTAGLTVLAFMVLVFVGIFDCMNPIMRSQMAVEGSHHSVADCVPGKNCGMDINKHIQIWEGMTTTNLHNSFSNLFAGLLLAFFVLAIWKTLVSPQTSSLTARYLYYNRDHPENKLYNHFIHIFSSGILQPKLFA